MNALTIKGLSFSYNKQTEVLKNVNVEFKVGKSYAIIGKSGSGKTTLISLLGGLDRVIVGDVKYFGEDIKKINLDKYRSEYVAMIYQSYNLLNNYSVLDNLLLAMKISKQPVKKEIVYELLEKVGLEKEMAEKKPQELSGGQQQRVAIARALIKNPEIIIADEPTGNLDEQTEREILELLKKIVKEENKTLIVVTHSNYVANNCDEVFGLNEGQLNIIK